MDNLTRTFAVAPMLDWTDRHERYFLRLLSPNALLYTEMVTTGALIHGDKARHLDFHPNEHPIALQLGGSDPQELATCAQIGAQWGYDEINLNVGCPSDRVQSGAFGACLMATPPLVANCVAAMRDVVAIPVTVKSRIGIDEQDDYTDLHQFITTVAAGGCNTFIIHARKAWLQGLSPKENRDIPPLRYDIVYAIKRDFPHLSIVINGGIKTLADVQQHLQHVDGVMIGREAYHNPYLLAELDHALFGSDLPELNKIIENFCIYAEIQLQKGIGLQSLTQHIMGLFQGMPGARQWRRYLSENAYKKGAGVEVIQRAADCVLK